MTDISDIKIIQAGMGVRVSNFKLANAVAREGPFLGVVSGTTMDQVLARSLQLGDPEGSFQRAMEHFPDQNIVDRVMDRYFIPNGKDHDANFKPLGSIQLKKDGDILRLKEDREDLITLGNFAEVWLAKEGHNGKVGINWLYHLKDSILPAMYGAMLAGVDAMIMGAGIPSDIPEARDSLLTGNLTSVKYEVANSSENYKIAFQPKFSLENKPFFLTIISSPVLQRMTTHTDGYIYEHFSAGGHNAPPRNKKDLDENGNPQYGDKDSFSLETLARLIDKPTWVAGGYASRLSEVLEAGLNGVQVGTLFSYAQESGYTDEVREEALSAVINGTEVVTDFKASPTGYPFKRLMYTDSEMPRLCDVGALTEAYEKNGKILRRCPSDKIDVYEASGGTKETEGKKCLCNHLLDNIGLGKPSAVPLITIGDNTQEVIELSKNGPYTAKDALNYILEH